MANQLIEDLVYVGFNRRVIALDRYTGEKIWDWKAAKGSGFPSILVDGDRLIVSVQGYTTCLEPITGAVVWENELKGFGTGIPSLASVRGSTSLQGGAAATAAAQQAAAAASGTHGVSS
jgi:outer membrane protein assembly factor BamB